MESISSLASTAAQTIWGEQDYNREPVSGVQGDVSRGEPFDAGNMEYSQQRDIANENGSRNAANASNANNNENPQPITGSGAAAQDPNAQAPSDDPKTGSSKSNPEEEKVEVTGQGPRPLDEVAREYGGDAGNAGSAAQSQSSGGSGGSANDKDSGNSNQTDDNRDGNESKGTGEEYVKTTGLAADGGDFDATKPGAGREADRLMEQKGVHREEEKPSTSSKADKDSPSASSSPSRSSKDKDKRDKPSLSERIKNKLHRN